MPPCGALRLAMCLLAGALTAPVALAQTRSADSAPAAPEHAGKQLHAFRIVGSPPRIDGQLNDEVWQAAPTIDDFVQGEPDNMRPPTEHTVVQVAFDDRYLYVAVRC